MLIVSSFPSRMSLRRQRLGQGQQQVLETAALAPVAQLDSASVFGSVDAVSRCFQKTRKTACFLGFSALRPFCKLDAVSGCRGCLQVSGTPGLANRSPRHETRLVTVENLSNLDFMGVGDTVR